MWQRCPLVLAIIASAASASNVLVVPSDDARALGLGDVVVEVLSNAGVPLKVAGAKAPAAACLRSGRAAERRACLVEVATQSNVSTVLVLTASEQRRVTVGSFELVSQATGKPLKAFTVRAPAARWARQATPQLRALKGLIGAQHFAEPPAPRVEARVEPKPEPVEAKPEPVEAKPEPPPEPVEPRPEPRPEPEPTVVAASDRPTSTTLTPAVEPEPLGLTSKAPARSHTLAWTATGVAVGAAALSGVLGGIGLASKGRLESAPDGIASLSHKQAVALQGQANGQLTGALVAGLVAVASGAAAGVLWGLER